MGVLDPDETDAKGGKPSKKSKKTGTSATGMVSEDTPFGSSMKVQKAVAQVQLVRI